MKELLTHKYWWSQGLTRRYYGVHTDILMYQRLCMLLQSVYGVATAGVGVLMVEVFTHMIQREYRNFSL